MQVNCLIAFTNNPHSLDVALNAIAFLRFCAMKLAEGDIGALIDHSSRATWSLCLAYNQGNSTCVTTRDICSTPQLSTHCIAVGMPVGDLTKRQHCTLLCKHSPATARNILC